MQTVEEIKIAYFNARKTGDVKEVHLTIDFYYQLIKDKDAFDVADMRGITKEYLPIFGLEPVVHFEQCDKPYWFEVALYRG